MASLKEKVLVGDPLLGTFMKTPSAMLAEVLTRCPLDLVCIDAEHSPFDRRDIDACILGLRSGAMPSLVRVPSCHPEHILNALDLGADGILAPHIITAQDARALVEAAQFGKGRGFSGSTRAAGYMAKPMDVHLRDSKGAAALVAQIEDKDALDNLDEILAVDGIDCIFIGRADLTVSLGFDTPDAPQVVQVVEDICKAATAAGKRSGMFTSNIAELGHWRTLGASVFLLGSDHSFLMAGAKALASQVASALKA